MTKTAFRPAANAVDNVWRKKVEEVALDQPLLLQCNPVDDLLNSLSPEQIVVRVVLAKEEK